PESNGAQVRQPLGNLGPGTYVVQWQVESGDTHPARGKFAFSVGQASPPTEALTSAEGGEITTAGLGLQSIGRWLHFSGYVLTFGILAACLVSRGSVPWRWVNAGIALLLLAEPFALFGQTSSLGLEQTFDSEVLFDALSTGFGRLF